MALRYLSERGGGFRKIVRDDRYGVEAWLRAAFRHAGPRTTKMLGDRFTPVTNRIRMTT
jgi:hypothetical protein